MRFALTTKSKKVEILNRTDSSTKEEAIEYFAKIKKLTKESLLSIFNVIEIK